MAAGTTGTVEPVEDAVTPAAPKRLRRGWRRLRRAILALLVLGLLAIGGPYAWTHVRSWGNTHARAADAPSAPVVIVFGAELAPGGERPKPFLAGRLDVAAELYRTGKARAVLVSGDGSGASGDETTAMVRYLAERGVPTDRIVADPSGLDTYDTCARAADVYGIDKALLVSQSFHLPRAVALCRHLGVEADGVDARCDDCRDVTLRKNTAREIGANVKAAWDAVSGRKPAVRSEPDPAITDLTGG